MSEASAPEPLEDPQELREFARQAFVTGAAVMLPLLVTLMVLGFVVNFVSQQLNPVVGLLTSAIGAGAASELALKLIAIVALLATVFVVGAVAERRPERSGLGALFDTLVSRIPGVGSLYRSIDEMSGLLLDSDTDSFQEVKLIEFPERGSYAVAFLTADTPDMVEEATDESGMQTVFLPMAPNPVMGGHVLHVAEEQVYDVDMSVEEGIQSIVTSGVATGVQSNQELPEDVLKRLNRRIDEYVDVDELERYAADASAQLEATARETVETARERLETDEREEDTDGTESPSTDPRNT